jgi:hypothetical protein
MIHRDLQLPVRISTEWPTTLTPLQRDQLLREKVARLAVWYQHSKSHDKTKHTSPANS